MCLTCVRIEHREGVRNRGLLIYKYAKHLVNKSGSYIFFFSFFCSFLVSGIASFTLYWLLVSSVVRALSVQGFQGYLSCNTSLRHLYTRDKGSHLSVVRAPNMRGMCEKQAKHACERLVANRWSGWDEEGSGGARALRLGFLGGGGGCVWHWSLW